MHFRFAEATAAAEKARKMKEEEAKELEARRSASAFLDVLEPATQNDDERQARMEAELKKKKVDEAVAAAKKAAVSAQRETLHSNS
jgi:hypothetical protein